MERREINAASAPQPASTYSQAVEVSDATQVLFVSGQVGAEVDGRTPGDVAAQARFAWRNVGANCRRLG